jgi:hypothetical protein
MILSRSLACAAMILPGVLGLTRAADAATLIGLTNSNEIVAIDTETRMAAKPVAVRGAEGTLLGIDQRPADGKLYGVTSAGQIVTVDPASGQAVQVSRLSERFEGGGRAVVDFNPMADRLRLMRMNGTNFRVHPDTGAVTRDGALKYQAGALGETVPRITAGAYTNSVGKPAATMLYTLDTLLGQLNLQAPPNDGVQQPKVLLGSLPAGAAFDIASPAEGDNTAWLLADGTLHNVMLDGGTLTTLGPVARLPRSEIIDVAAMR